jgi:hypothetical protein
MTAPRRTTTQRRRPGPTIPQPDIPPPDEYAAAWAAPRPDPRWTPPPGDCRDRAYGKMARQGRPGASQRSRPRPAAMVAIILAQEADRLQGSSRLSRSDGVLVLRVLSRRPRRHGVRPVPRPRRARCWSGQRRCPPSNSGCSPRPSGPVFDSNDFDETLPGPEWDVKRLAASVAIASRANGSSPAPPARRSWPRSRISGADGALFGDAAARDLV